MKKYFYYIDLGLRCYEVVWSDKPLDTTSNREVKVKTLRDSHWTTPACELYEKRLNRMEVPNSDWVTISDAIAYFRTNKINSILEDEG